MPASENTNLNFTAYNIPLLEAGQYTLGLTLDLSVTGSNPGSGSWTPELVFYVSAPRFTLGPQDVYSFFPPDQDSGIPPTTLPSLTLNRSSLPWERTPGGTLPNNSWLALLLFDESEMNDSSGVSVSNMPLNQYSPPGGLETSDDPESIVSILSIPQSIATNVIPAWNDLQWNAHIRQSTNSSDASANGTERATIIGTRLPQPGSRSYVFLVSLENQYVQNGQTYSFRMPSSGNVQLPVLLSWEFSSETSDTDFMDLLLNLNLDPPTLRLPAVAYSGSGPNPEDWLSQGYVALPHNMRNGESSVSWFHGPLGTGVRTVPFTLPAASADALLIYDATTGMFDTGYSAAWQLGRLLALQDQSFALSLYKWKQENAILDAQIGQSEGFAYLPVVNTQSRWSDVQSQQTAFLRLNTEGTSFSSINGSTITVTSSVSLATWINDTFGASINLPSDSGAELTINNALDSFDAEFSVSFWFYTYPENSGTAVLFELDRNDAPYLQLMNAGTMLQLNIDGTVYDGPAQILSGWQQIVLSSWNDTSGNTIFEIYLGGSLVITQSVTAVEFSGNLYSGCNLAYDTSGANGSFSGNLANLRIFTEALEASDLDALIKADLSGQTLFPFFNTLALLKNVPFNYLVNNEAMLPQESIRFFTLDMSWMNCLLDGGFSIGRLTPSQLQQDAASFEMLGLNPLQSASGFLIRSQVISAWPDMQVNGYSTNQGNSTPDESTAMPLLRIDRLSQNILFCLFSGQVQTVDLHLKPEALHSGVSTVSGTSSFTKILRNPDGSVSSASVTQNFLNSSLVISLNNLATAINGSGLGFNTFSSGELGMEMLEGVPNIRFNITN